MQRLLRHVVLTLMLACLAAGCATQGTKSDCPCLTGAKAGADSEKAGGLSKQRLMLSQGYSMLYQDATALGRGELILYAKIESDKFDQIVTAMAEFGSKLKGDLERIARDYPGVRIDLDPLPEMEKRKREALGKDRARDFAPVVGRGGREYERTVLIAFSNGINHERFLCRVMAEEEPDAGLKKFLTDTGKGYDRLYDRTMALLEQEHFKNPGGKTQE